MNVPHSTTPFVIGIDGPSGVGKTTLGEHLAQHYNYAFLDTGLLYRWVALLIWKVWGENLASLTKISFLSPQHDRIIAVLEANVPSVGSMVEAFWKNHPLVTHKKILGREDLADLASHLSSWKEVRKMLLPMQRLFGSHPPHDKKGAVLVGRDVTTTVCPHGDFLLFLDAQEQVRKERIHKRSQNHQPSRHQGVILKMRDQRDRIRTASPLIQRDDIHILDTTYLSVDESIRHIKALVDQEK